MSRDASGAITFRGILRASPASYTPLVLLTLAGVTFQVLGPVTLAKFLDAVARGGNTASLSYLFELALAFITCTVVAQICRIRSIREGADLAWRRCDSIRIALTKTFLHLDIEAHSNITPGELIERVEGDTTKISVFLTQVLTQILWSSIMLFGIFGVLLIVYPQVGAAMLLFGGLAGVALNMTRNLGVGEATKEREARAKVAGFVEERMNGLDELRANGATDYVSSRLDRLSAEVLRTAWAATRVTTLFPALISNGTFLVGFAVALTAGVWLLFSGRASVGQVYLLLQLAAMLRAPIEAIGVEMAGVPGARAALSRAAELLSQTPQITAGKLPFPTAKAPSLRFEHVSFGYGASDNFLKNLDFEVPAGCSVGVLGRTGSGKSTIARLACRLYDVRGGRVLIDGTDIRDIRATDLRQGIGLVTQDVQLIQGNVRDNVALFSDVASDSAIQSVIDQVGLSSWLEARGGLDSQIASGGAGLSAGEAQLLALARVLLREPQVLILDEASSRLDPASQRLIKDAVSRVVRDNDQAARTSIVIAHRLETVAHLDKILMMEHGAIVEFGDRIDLLKNPQSHYARLVAGDFEEEVA